MAATQLSVCNMALSLCGQKAATSVASPTRPEEVACALWWDDCRQEVLRVHEWQFATTTATLSLTSPTVTPPDYAYQYELPSGCLRPCELVLQQGISTSWNVLLDSNVPQNPQVPPDFLIRSGKLLTNYPSAILRYVADITDPSLWDANFRTAFAYRLAAAINAVLTADPQRSAALYQSYQQLIDRAASIDSTGWNITQPDRNNSIVAARY